MKDLTMQIKRMRRLLPRGANDDHDEVMEDAEEALAALEKLEEGGK